MKFRFNAVFCTLCCMYLYTLLRLVHSLMILTRFLCTKIIILFLIFSWFFKCFETSSLLCFCFCQIQGLVSSPRFRSFFWISFLWLDLDCVLCMRKVFLNFVQINLNKLPVARSWVGFQTWAESLNCCSCFLTYSVQWALGHSKAM